MILESDSRISSLECCFDDYTFIPDSPSLQRRYLTGLVDFHLKENRPNFPSYFLEELNSVAYLIGQAVENGTGILPPTISNFLKEQERIRGNIHYIIDDLQKEYLPEKRDSPYSASETLLYKLLWQGEEIMPELSQFTDSMINSLQKNPKIFWKVFNDFGFRKILPYFRDFDNIEFATISNKLISSDITTLRDAFDLLPSLTPYYDSSPGKEQQSDEYFMRIILAMAYHSYQTGNIAIASCIVRDGKIIAAAHNRGMEGGVHAEAIAIEQAKSRLGEYDGNDCTIYITTGPCGGCVIQIREHAKGIINRVVCGPPSTMTDIKSLNAYKNGNSIYGRRPKIDVIKTNSDLGRMLLYSYQEVFQYLTLFPYWLYPYNLIVRKLEPLKRQLTIFSRKSHQ